jgi:hypothetical protein
MVELYDGKTLGQTFVSNFDYLFKISVFLSTKIADKDAILKFHLRQEDSDKDIVFKEWKVSEIKPEKNNFYQIPPDLTSDKGFHYHIQFNPIRDSQDKKFYFFFETDNVTQDKSIKFGIWKQKYYEALRAGNLMVNHKPVDNFLAFRTYNTWQGEILDVIDVIKQRLLLDKGFLYFYILLMTTLFGALLFVCFKCERSKI